MGNTSENPKKQNNSTYPKKQNNSTYPKKKNNSKEPTKQSNSKEPKKGGVPSKSSRNPSLLQSFFSLSLPTNPSFKFKNNPSSKKSVHKKKEFKLLDSKFLCPKCGKITMHSDINKLCANPIYIKQIETEKVVNDSGIVRNGTTNTNYIHLFHCPHCCTVFTCHDKKPIQNYVDSLNVSTTKSLIDVYNLYHSKYIKILDNRPKTRTHEKIMRDYINQYNEQLQQILQQILKQIEEKEEEEY